jgi:hypothetical protein
MECQRKSHAVGGLLFRCAMCPAAYCDDHMPEQSVIIRHCQRFVNMGIPHPKQACYILCDPECQQRAKDHLPPDEQPQHVALAFDRCATAAAQAAEAERVAMQNVEEMLESEAAKKAGVPIQTLDFGLADPAERDAILEADRLLGGGFLSGPRSTRNKIVSYAGPKGQTILAESDECVTHARTRARAHTHTHTHAHTRTHTHTHTRARAHNFQGQLW